MKHPVNSLAERYGTNGHRVVLYTGTFEPYQGLDLLVEAAQEVVRARQSVRFLCAGGNEKQIDSFKHSVDQRRVTDYFIFTGLLSPEDVEHLFKIASILVSPRTSGTNTPLKIYSYLRSGVPIVATNIVSHTQVLTHDVALLVEPVPNALGAGILRLLDDVELGARLSQNARLLAEQSYSQDAYHRKVAEVFAFLAANSRAKA
jgi:glycosyltransferase involved in cell wall biosynthesis